MTKSNRKEAIIQGTALFEVNVRLKKNFSVESHWLKGSFCEKRQLELIGSIVDFDFYSVKGQNMANVFGD